MSRFTGQQLLERFDHQLHQHAAEIEELREAGVPEHRIHALYPSSDDYTARLSQALGDSKVHAKVRRIFQPSAAVLPMKQITYEMRWNGRGMRAFVTEELTAKLVEQLRREHPTTYRQPNAAHAFASMIYIIPVVLPALDKNPKVEFSQLSVGGRLEIKTKDFFWRVDQLLLALR